MNPQIGIPPPPSSQLEKSFFVKLIASRKREIDNVRKNGGSGVEERGEGLFLFKKSIDELSRTRVCPREIIIIIIKHHNRKFSFVTCYE